MSRGAPRRDESTVSLFPFLAVLICTMGALIVLLVVLVQQASVPDAVPEPAEPVQSSPQVARVEAAQPVSTEPQVDEADKPDGPALETLDLQIADSQWRAEMLEESRAEALRRLRDHQLTLSRVEDRARTLAERLEALQAEARRIAVAGDSESAEAERSRDQLDRLQASIAEAMQQLESARREAAENRQLYAIVPYDGPNGTERRPIYVECLGNRVILQPEGIELGSVDFTEPMGPDNALAESLRAVREYLLDAEVTDSALDPYPLLIVRPDGARAYAACRRALQGWDDEFGYELVPADIKLKYPDPDPALALILQKVVAQSRQRNRFVASRRVRARKGVLLSADPRTGGFVTQDGESAGDYASNNGASNNGASNNGASNNGDIGKQGRSTGAPGGGGEGARGAGALNNVVPPPDAVFGGGMPAGSTWGPPNASPTASSQSIYGTSVPGRPGDRGATGQPAGWGPNLYGGGNSSAGPAHGPGDSGPGGGSGPGGDSIYGTAGQGEAGGGPGGTATQDGTSGGPGSASTGAAGSAARGTPGASGQNSTGSASARPPGETAAGNFSLPGPNHGQPNSSAAMAFGGGRNWGLPNATDGAIGITRPVYVSCTPDTLVLRSSTGKSEPIPFAGTTQSAVRPFVTQLWKHIESWGIAGSGCYWKPVLKVDVGPGGEARFAEFASLLKNSGLEVVRR